MTPTANERQEIPVVRTVKPGEREIFLFALDLALKLGLGIDAMESAVPCAREWLTTWAAERDLKAERDVLQHGASETQVVRVSHGRFRCTAFGEPRPAAEPRVTVDANAMWVP